MDIGTRVQRPGLPYKSFDYLVTYYPAELASEVWKAGARGAALRWGAWTHLRLETASAILQVSRVTTFLIWQVEGEDVDSNGRPKPRVPDRGVQKMGVKR